MAETRKGWIYVAVVVLMGVGCGGDGGPEAAENGEQEKQEEVDEIDVEVAGSVIMGGGVGETASVTLPVRNRGGADVAVNLSSQSGWLAVEPSYLEVASGEVGYASLIAECHEVGERQGEVGVTLEGESWEQSIGVIGRCLSTAPTEEEIPEGAVQLEARWPSGISADWALVDSGGESVFEGSIGGGDIAMVAVKPDDYEVQIVEEVVDEWDNPWHFEGVEEAFEVGEGASVEITVEAQAPTWVTDGADDGAYGSLREVMKRVHPGSLIEIREEVEVVVLDAPLVVSDGLRLMGQGRHDSLIRSSQGFEPTGGALIEVAAEDEEVEVLVQGVAMSGASGAAASAMVVDASGMVVQVDIVDSEWAQFDGALVMEGEGSVEVDVEWSSFLANYGVDGGAIRADGEAASEMVLRIHDGFFADNQVSGRGGAIFVGDGVDVELSSVSFEHSQADEKGGALYVSEGDGEVRISEGIWSWDSAGESGGAAYFAREATVEKAEVKNCSADAYGGGMVFRDDSGELIRSVFKNNEAPRGGALALKGVGRASSVMNQPVWGFAVNQVLFEANEAQWEGGAIWVEGSNLFTRGFVDLDNSTFSGNESGEAGGAIYWGNEAVGTVNFSTFVENQCGSCDGGGPGIWVDSEAVRVQLRANVARDNGSGGHLDFESGGGTMRSGGKNHFAQWSGEAGGGFELVDSDVVHGNLALENLGGEGYRRGHDLGVQSPGNWALPWESCQRQRLDRFGNAHERWNPVAQNGLARPVGHRCSAGAIERFGYSEFFEAEDLPLEVGSGQFEGQEGLIWEYNNAYQSEVGAIAGGAGLVLDSQGSEVRVDGIEPGAPQAALRGVAVLFRVHGPTSDGDRQVRVKADGAVIGLSETLSNGQSILVIDGLQQDSDLMWGGFELVIENNAPGVTGAVLIDHVSWY